MRHADRLIRPVKGKERHNCHCGKCDRCVEFNRLVEEEEARFARLLDPNYYARRPVRWRSSLSGGYSEIIVTTHKKRAA